MKKKGTRVRLQDTATHTKRWAFFQPMFYLPGKLVVGVLEVHQSKGKTSELTSRYLVEQLDREDSSETKMYFRLFLTAALAIDVPSYSVQIDVDEQSVRESWWVNDSRCDCKGFVSAGHCKHLDSMREMTRVGAFSPARSGRLPTFTPGALRAGILRKTASFRPDLGKGKGKPPTPLSKSKRRGKTSE